LFPERAECAGGSIVPGGNRRKVFASRDEGLRAGRVEQVAEEVGHSSAAHFTAAFRRRFGLSPNRFRGLARRPIRRSTASFPAGFVQVLGGREPGSGPST